LHAHTRWSDGAFGVRELVDLHGRLGYDMLCVTDHALRQDRAHDATSHVTGARYEGYLDEIVREGRRAWSRYRLLLVPGLELTYDADHADESAHVVALGLEEYVAVEPPLDELLRRARATGATLIAAHPDGGSGEASGRRTRAFARNPELWTLVDRFELFNRTAMFGWVAQAGLLAVASGNVHRFEHFDGWKTLVPCAREPEAVLEHLRSERPVYLARAGGAPRSAAA
jgi:predicted metal-dependent phosphoesterase TrpH